MRKATVVLSLDTELAWGYVNSNTEGARRTLAILNKNKHKIRKTFDMLLNQFQTYKIPVTWAIVGYLLSENAKSKINDYHRSKNYYAKKVPQDQSLYYGKDIIQKILDNPIEHEIGYHSFSHPVFTELSERNADEEIKLGKQLAKENGLELRSFVFPENRVYHVKVLKENNFLIYRGELANRYDINQNFLFKKINGMMYKLIARPTTPRWQDGIWETNGSMPLSDQQVPFTLIPRTKIGIKRACFSNKVFHVCFHPHSIFLYDRFKDDLKRFLQMVYKKRKQGKIDVKTMYQLAQESNKQLR